jgi:hypothetical protein
MTAFKLTKQAENAGSVMRRKQRLRAGAQPAEILHALLNTGIGKVRDPSVDQRVIICFFVCDFWLACQKFQPAKNYVADQIKCILTLKLTISKNY